ncbi:MAG: class I SAM-dependent methyltransferase [Anaerolineae bacterium]
MTILSDTRSAYDTVALNYAQQFRDEMDHKPYDREMLMRLAERVNGLGVICDLGCGPGQIARYLARQGVAVCGVDLSAEMVRQASLLNPTIPFQQGNMLALDRVTDNSWGGVAAFYSIIHIPRHDVVNALREIKRALKPGGTLLAAFHIGDEVKHIDEWWGKPVSVDFTFFQPVEMEDYMQAAGYEQIEINVRSPYPEIEFQSRRAYIFAVKPQATPSPN